MVSKSTLKAVVDILEAAFVCKRCILRYFGSKEYTNYISKSTVDKIISEYICQDNEILDNTPADSFNNDENHSTAKRVCPGPCALCLGILQDGCDEVLQKIANEVLKSRHKFKDFVLQVSLPVIIDLRERLFSLHLKEHFGESYSVPVGGIPSVKDVCKWIIGSQYGSLTQTDFTPYSDFQVFISSHYSQTVKECSVLFQKMPDLFPNARKRHVKIEDVYTRAAVTKAMDALAVEIKKLYAFPPAPPDRSLTFGEVRCSHSPLYLGGRYNKFSRELSQTPWILEGERKMESSVQELITDVVQRTIEADKIVFSAAGREDVDVKMLGNGRPFLLELVNPRCLEWSAEELKVVEQEINRSTDVIAVKHLQVVSKDEILLLKEGEEQKRKTYSALCLVEKTLREEDVTKLESLKDLTLYQKTPIRVLHRRTLSTRTKLLHSVKATIVSDHLLKLALVTQAGTYVKEFVHGDFGRTTPSLGSLLDTRADILELDVEVIDLDWPPKTS